MALGYTTTVIAIGSFMVWEGKADSAEVLTERNIQQRAHAMTLQVATSFLSKN